MSYSKSGLAIELSKLEVFASPNPKLEQYPTDSEIAAEVLWQANMIGDIQDVKITDLGCGTGILGIGALLLGAKKVFFVDTDASALSVLKNNLKNLNIKKGFKIINSDLTDFNEKTDMIIQNPPFGTKEKHVDRSFLEKAFTMTDTIYSFHKTSTSNFINKFARDNDFEITNKWNFNFPLKQTLKFHKKKIQRIKVSCFRFKKNN